jgi:hypothetical protein
MKVIGVAIPTTADDHNEVCTGNPFQLKAREGNDYDRIRAIEIQTTWQKRGLCQRFVFWFVCRTENGSQVAVQRSPVPNRSCQATSHAIIAIIIT